MDRNLDYTMKFECISEEKLSIKETLQYVYEALEEKKRYDPIDQIIGYILSGDSSYITSNRNARSIIKKYERDELLKELLKIYLSKE